MYVWQLRVRDSDGMVLGYRGNVGLVDGPASDGVSSWCSVTDATMSDYWDLHRQQTESGRSPVQIICTGATMETRSLSSAPDSRPRFVLTPSAASVDGVVRTEVGQPFTIDFEQTAGDPVDAIDYSPGPDFALTLTGTPRRCTADATPLASGRVRFASDPNLIVDNPFEHRAVIVGRAAS